MKKVGDLLRQFMREQGWETGSPWAPLFRDWPAIAGHGLAAHARLVDVQKGFLLVEVDHPGWLQMAQLRTASLLEAARRAAPGVEINGLKLRVGGSSSPGAR
jgi:predicted nucleic acid-binding Zn ribbon protein